MGRGGIDAHQIGRKPKRTTVKRTIVMRADPIYALHVIKHNLGQPGHPAPGAGHL